MHKEIELSHNYCSAFWAKSELWCWHGCILLHMYNPSHSFFWFVLYALIVLISLFLYALIWILLSAVSLQFALWVAQQAPSFFGDGRYWKKYLGLFLGDRLVPGLLHLASCKFMSVARWTAKLNGFLPRTEEISSPITPYLPSQNEKLEQKGWCSLWCAAAGRFWADSLAPAAMGTIKSCLEVFFYWALNVQVQSECCLSLRTAS